MLTQSEHHTQDLCPHALRLGTVVPGYFFARFPEEAHRGCA